jgi:hypothetical protein
VRDVATVAELTEWEIVRGWGGLSAESRRAGRAAPVNDNVDRRVESRDGPAAGDAEHQGYALYAEQYGLVLLPHDA